MLMFKRILLGTVTAFIVATGANAVVIDDFTDELELLGASDGVANGIVSDATANGSSHFDRTVQNNGNIIGGDRELIINKSDGIDEGSGNLASASIVLSGGNGVFTHSNGAGVTGSSLLRWDGSGDGDTDGRDYNLNQSFSPDEILHISVLVSDLVGSTLEITLYTDEDSYSWTSLLIPTGPSEHFLTFAELAAPQTGSDGGVDLDNVNAIEFYANGVANFDFAVDLLDTLRADAVPEPASLTLLGMGLAGLSYFARRRNV